MICLYAALKQKKKFFTNRSAVSPEYCKLKNILVESVLTDGILFVLSLSFKALLIIELQLFTNRSAVSREYCKLKIYSRSTSIAMEISQINVINKQPNTILSSGYLNKKLKILICGDVKYLAI